MSSSQEKLSKWLSLPKEEKVKIIKEILNYFVNEAKENRVVALTEFLAWLASEDGAIVYPWMWKEKYRVVMIDIAANVLRVVNRVITKGL